MSFTVGLIVTRVQHLFGGFCFLKKKYLCGIFKKLEYCKK